MAAAQPGKANIRPLRMFAVAALQIAAAAVALGGCSTPQERTPAPAAATAPAPAAMPSVWPIDTTLYRTTSGAIYFGNLDARIDSLRQQVGAGRADLDATLAGALYHRYKLRGRLRDAEEALSLLDRAAANGALSADGAMLRAVVLSGFHRFDEAERQLQQAKAAGVTEAALRNFVADINVATGRYDALRADFDASALPVGDFYALAHRADLRVLLGDLPGAERQYLAAQAIYTDVNPVPLAWLHTQMGIALLRFGEVERARVFFAAAVERLPGYTLAEEHLAECDTRLGQLDAARERYRRVIAETGNPEFIAALAGLERQAGHAAEARRLTAAAVRGYDALLATYPAAYAQHAAEFFVEIGEAARALALAEANVALRSDVGSRILLAQTAHAAGRRDLACRSRQQAQASGLRPPELQELLAWREQCN